MARYADAESNNALLHNRVDDINNLGEESPETSSPKSIFSRRTLKNKKWLMIIAGSITFACLLLTVLAYSYIHIEVSVPEFKEGLIRLTTTKYKELENGVKEDYVKELTELYKLGHVSSDHEFELEVMIQFHEFNKEFNKRHKDLVEKRKRFLNFRLNFIEVNTKRSHETYVKGLSIYSDLSKDEFMSLFPPFKNSVNLKPMMVESEFVCPAARYADNKTYLKNLMVAKGLDKISDVCEINGEDIDWRKGDSVTPVRNQGNCGSCWAFATVGAVESLYKIQKDQDVELSPQELIDCDLNSFGCDGGFTDLALKYIKDHGISHESELPYRGVNGVCMVKDNDKKYISGYLNNSGYGIPRLLLPMGPVIVHVAVDDSWASYSSGIFNGSCAETTNHGVLLVGEGYDEELKKRYWIIKNSWGSKWGENGYIRLERTNDGSSDKCSLLQVGRVPLLY